MTEKEEAPEESATPVDRGTATAVRKPPKVGFYVLIAAGLFLLSQTFGVLSPILLSFLLIVLVTHALYPLITRLRTWAGGRKRATGILLAGVVILLGVTGWAAAGSLKESIISLSNQLPEYWERLQKPLIKMEQKAILSEEKLQEEVSEEIAKENGAGEESEGGAATAGTDPRPEKEKEPEDEEKERDKDEGSLRSSLLGMLQGVFGQIKGLAVNTTQMLVVLVTVFFGVTFTLMNPRPIIAAVFSMVPERNHTVALTIMQRIARFVPRWAGAMLISMLTIGSLFFVLMWPIFGFADAFVLGLLSFLLSAIPFLGPLLSVIPALLLAIGEGGMTPVWVLVAYLAVQALEGNVILPLIMSRGMQMHPLAVIFSMLVSVAAFGVLGVLIAAPLVAIVSIMHEELYRKRFLPTVTDSDLERLSRRALLEKPSVNP